MNNAVEVKNLSKRYTIGQKERYLTLRDLFVKAAKAPINLAKGKKFAKKEQFWALKDVNFEVKEGEVVGIIGRNGAGKSTLLKILSRITEPTEGEVKLNGRVSSLLEVGTGFHPELTGRENIYLNGAILGMRKKEIDEKFDEIVEFSGVEKFLDMPVKRYSSGMQVRLAFSIAAHLEPDILIIDEVLAVGDAEFQKKCLGKMDQVTKEAGRTILFVSHDMGAVQRLCKKTILLEDGKVVMYDETEKVVSYYMSNINKGSSIYNYENDLSKEVKITSVKIKNESKEIKGTLKIDESFEIEIEYQLNKELNGYHISTICENILGTKIFASESSESIGLLNNIPGKYHITFKFPKTGGIFLNTGSYMVRISIGYPQSRPIDSATGIPIELFGAYNKRILQTKKEGFALNISGEWFN